MESLIFLEQRLLIGRERQLFIQTKPIHGLCQSERGLLPFQTRFAIILRELCRSLFRFFSSHSVSLDSVSPFFIGGVERINSFLAFHCDVIHLLRMEKNGALVSTFRALNTHFARHFSPWTGKALRRMIKQICCADNNWNSCPSLSTQAPHRTPNFVREI